LHAAVGLALALSLKTLPPDPPEAPASRWSLSAAFVGTYQVLPNFAPGLDLAAHWAPVPNVAFRVGALGNAAFDAELKRDIGRVDATLVAARPDVCLRFTLIDDLHAHACAGVLAGALYIRGTDFKTAHSSVVPWVAFANAVGLELDLSTHWSIALDFSVAFLFHDVRIRIEDISGAEVDGQSLDRAGFALGIGPMYNF
jgi:hypothetical protein